MKFRSCWFVFLVLCICITASLPAQLRVETRGCTLKKNQYNCDKNSFAQVLKGTPSISVIAPRLDPSSLKRMDELAKGLGKTVRSDSDLRLVLAQSTPTGIYYGPSDRELATIRAYYGSDGKLLWVESYYGQPDTPWPLVVNRLVQQFHDNFRQ